jgi:hypothetical protein
MQSMAARTIRVLGFDTVHDTPKHPGTIVVRKSLEHAKQNRKLTLADTLGPKLVQQVVKLPPVAFGWLEFLNVLEHREYRVVAGTLRSLTVR